MRKGYPSKRYYGGCEHVDVAEDLAIARAKNRCRTRQRTASLRQSANQAVYSSVISAGRQDSYNESRRRGHLTHGHPANFSGKLYEVVNYGVDPDSGLIDYEILPKGSLRKTQTHNNWSFSVPADHRL